MVASWAATAAGGLLAFDGGEQLALLHVVTLFDVEVGDAAEGGGADIDIGLGLDLPGAADGGDEVSVDGLGGGDRGNVRTAVNDCSSDDAAHDYHDEDNQQNLLTGHRRFL